jgi:hypothetical protein
MESLTAPSEKPKNKISAEEEKRIMESLSAPAPKAK